MNENHIETNQKQEDCEKDQDSDVPDDENDEESKDTFEGYNGSGRTVTLQMLLAANVLQPGKSSMTIEYLGQKFIGDLLADGKIKSQETETIFLSPSAWAMHCKRIINPEKKSGCGWASVKYKGKKLDAYKASWMRKCAQQKDVLQDDDENFIDLEKKNEIEVPVIKRAILPHNSINNRNIMHDANTLVEIVPFSSINKMQPFLVNISSNAMLLADFHSHLTFQEVCGYFGGTWDVNSHSLVIMKSYPCKNTKYDREKAPEIESEIQKQITIDQLIVVGWYHSHPKFQSEPTLRDCDTQLDYQIKMRGPSDMTYTPCVGVIFSPYYDNNEGFQSSSSVFWIVPPAENRQIIEYGRPMLMQYEILSDIKVTESVKQEMQSCVFYYTKFRNELIDFSALYRQDFTFIEKLKYALYSKFPRNQNDKEFWNWVCRMLKCPENEKFDEPITVNKIENKEILNVNNNLKADEHFAEVNDNEQKSTTPELKILSLQEQLCLPSGLNMNPSKLCATLATPSSSTILNSTTENPITIPPNSAKFEVPVRASPSPAKSDTSSTRTRNSPAPSPGKFNISDNLSVTPNKFDQNVVAAFHTSNSENGANELIASNLVASLAGQIPANLSTSDLTSFFQKEYGNTTLKQLAVSAAKIGGGNAQVNELFDKHNNDFQFISHVGGSQKHSMSDHTKATTKTNQENNKLMKSQNSNSSYKTKLMKELDDLKNDPLKISELMRSPEYAALLLQQAEALGATTLGTLGLGVEFPFIGAGNLKNKSSPSDYANMLQTSKLLGYEAFMQPNKNQSELNTFFQQHIPTTSSKKNSKQSKQSDYATLLQTYSKLFEAENSFNSNKLDSNLVGNHELSTLLNAGANSCNSKNKDSSEVLNHLLQSDKNATELNNLLFQQSKSSQDLNSLFASSNVVGNLSSPSSKNVSSDPSSYYSQLNQDKMQEYAALFQQNHGKYGIPDPLSKSTLAANNLFMPPSTLLKLHQESLSAMMMKPPKSSPGGATKNFSTTLPAQDRLTPTKSNREQHTPSLSTKYNFSAVDLAISSVPNVSLSPSPSSNCPINTPPVDLSRLYTTDIPRKRMEFSSIADLVAPPPSKVAKLNDRDDILNLSSNE